MAEPLFHVVLEGRTIGPYGWRTIVGMRVRKTLASSDVLVDADGRRLTVGELIERRNRATGRAAIHRSSGFSIVLATFPAHLLGVEGQGYDIPRFRGEIEARVQGDDVLRLAGRFRRGLRWREDRIKLPLGQVVHARVGGSVVELWLQRAGAAAPPQRVVLELFTPEAAGELVDWLPAATPWPHSQLPLPEPETAPSARVRWPALAAILTVLLAAAAAWR